MVSSPTPAPTATTAKTAEAPGSRVPVGCASLLESDTVAALAGTDAKVSVDENTTPSGIVSIAQLQFGALPCLWVGRSVTGASGPGAELRVDVAPDSTTGFESNFAAIMADQSKISHPAATENVAGDQSGYWCANEVDALGADQNLSVCDGELLVSGYWASVQVDTVSGITRAQLLSGMAKAITDLASNLAKAGPALAQWVAPASTPPAFCTAPTSTATVRTVTGDASLELIPNAQQQVRAATVGLVGPDARCSWASPSSSVSVDLLAGGSWAFPAIRPEATGDVAYAQQPYLAVTVAGATSAVEACGGRQCDAYLAVKAMAVEIRFTDPGANKRAIVLGGFVTSIDAG